MLKKILLSIVLSTYLFVFFGSKVVSPIYAQTAGGATGSVWYFQKPYLWYKQVYQSNPTDIFGERYTAAQVSWVIMAFGTYFPTLFLGSDTVACILEGLPPMLGGAGSIDVGTCLNGIMGLADGTPNQQSSLAQLFNSFSVSKNYNPDDVEKPSVWARVMQDRPLSGITYTKYALRKLTLISDAKAQEAGFGYETAFNGLPRKIWQTSREISYTFFVIAAVALSFMIMFRMKISPQTAISIQSALPKLVIALVLVTFSFAIAGFLVDFMYIIIAIISVMFDGVVPRDEHLPELFDILTTGFYGTGVLGFMFFDLFAMPITLWLGFIAMAGASGTIASPALETIFAILGFVVMIVFFLVLLIALFFIFIKISWLLLKTTGTILILVMLAPIQIVLGTFINGLGFGAWMKNMLSNLMVFPTMGLLFTLSYLFLAEAFNTAVDEIDTLSTVRDWLGLMDPSPERVNIGDGWPPLLGGAGDPGALVLLGISVVLLFTTPKAAELIKTLIAGKPFGFGYGVGDALGPVGGIGGMYAQNRLGRELTAREAAASFYSKQPTATEAGLAARMQASRRTKTAQDLVAKVSRGKLW